MPVHGKCLVEHNAKKLDCVRELEAGALPATLTPPAVSALPNTTVSVLDGFNRRPFSRSQWVMSSVQLIN